MVKIDASWYEVLRPQFEAPYFAQLKDFLVEERKQYTCYPPGSKIFAAFDHTPFDKVKVVIIGQDPYHEPNQAQGLCFSVPDGVKVPPSLVNIIKEINSDLGVTIPENTSVMFGPLSGSKLGIWVAHGEGKFSFPAGTPPFKGGWEGLIVLRYTYDQYPGCPNGSDFAAAGICTPDGRHLAMMPHLERAFLPWQNPYYPCPEAECTPWLAAFTNARRWCQEHQK